MYLNFCPIPTFASECYYECMTIMSDVKNRRTVSENRKHMKLNLDFETLVRKILTCARNHNNYTVNPFSTGNLMAMRNCN